MLLAATDPELFDRTQWFAATSARREQIARAVALRLGADFEYVGLRNYAGTDLEIAVLRHRQTDALFSVIPGGSFEMGMSPEEEQAIIDARPEDTDEEDDFNQEFDLLLSEMGTLRPLHSVRVPPFLIAQRILSVGQVRRFIDDFVDPLYGHDPEVPAHLTPEQSSAILIGTDLRLPSEAELEYAARGHLARTLLPTSTRIPDEDLLEAMLADRADATSNAFGIHGYGLYPERCADAWHEHYKNAPTDGSPRLGPGPRVVRGGAANCYPWQGAGEWNAMLCAFRMSDRHAEFGSAIRLARSLAQPTDDPQPLDFTPETPATEQPTTKTRKTAAKKSTTKAAAKQTPAKKTAAKKSTAKKTTTKAAAKKSTAKKSTTKKSTAKKSTAKKTTAKKTTTKKSTAKKSTAKKTTAKKTTAKKTTAKKSTAKKSTKKTAAKAAPAKKSAKKTATRKSNA